MYQSRIGQQRARIVSSYRRLHEKATGRETVEIEFVDDLIRGFIVAGFAAGFAVHQSIVADADVHSGLAETAEFLTFARALGLLTLRAAVFSGSGSSAHAPTLTCSSRCGKMTFVMGSLWENLSRSFSRQHPFFLCGL
jgi:hypothetical protein